VKRRLNAELAENRSLEKGVAQAFHFRPANAGLKPRATFFSRVDVISLRMRVVLVGSVNECTRLRARLAGTSIEIVGEERTLAAARAAGIDADAFMLAPELEVRDGLEPERARPSVRRTHWEALDVTDGVKEEPLTPREIQVLELVAEGLSNKRIAARLDISDQTVKFHVSSMCGKLGAVNRTDAVRRALRRGLITL
jgi:DNA-binding CsgD family transcriptional regulator